MRGHPKRTKLNQTFDLSTWLKHAFYFLSFGPLQPNQHKKNRQNTNCIFNNILGNSLWQWNESQFIALAVAEPENASKGQDPASSFMGEGRLWLQAPLSLKHTRISSVSLGCCELAQRPKSCFPRIVAMAGWMMTKHCWWSGGESLLISRSVRWGLEESWLQKHPLRTAVPDETNARRIRRIGQGGQSSRWWNRRVEPVLHSHLFGHGALITMTWRRNPFLFGSVLGKKPMYWGSKGRFSRLLRLLTSLTLFCLVRGNLMGFGQKEEGRQKSGSAKTGQKEEKVSWYIYYDYWIFKREEEESRKGFFVSK